ncbi:uncharacterized protein LOC135216426 isoform X2 [Macrobrachium nipponense]|uniref:uncharacterized protein LOC135216426 isoform X2 n=1 Tax=Macrobrachium nipponense TaxID=159736 RepID=UPI0030C88117
MRGKLGLSRSLLQMMQFLFFCTLCAYFTFHLSFTSEEISVLKRRALSSGDIHLGEELAGNSDKENFSSRFATVRPPNITDEDLQVFVLLVTSSILVSSRPQEGGSGTFDLRPSQPLGSFIGEIVVSSSHVAVKPKSKRKRPEKNEAEEEDGPRFSKFIGGPESELTVSAGAGPSVAVASGPSLSISGSTITFNKPAEVLPIGPNN